MGRALLWAAAIAMMTFAVDAPAHADGYEAPRVKRPPLRRQYAAVPARGPYGEPRGHGVTMDFWIDPYLYTYEPRGYYPYYNAGYWKPNCGATCKPYYEQPPYWQAWGYAVPVWVRPYEGRIRRHHW